MKPDWDKLGAQYKGSRTVLIADVDCTVHQGHCKSMKPDWDKLGAQYKGSRTVLIADVDCTVHQGLCGEYGVQGYPTVKYFLKDGPKGGQDYQGGRDFNALKKFVETTLDTLPACSLENMDDCEPWERKILEEGKGMSTAD